MSSTRYSDIAATAFEFSFAMASALRCAEMLAQEERLISPELGGLRSRRGIISGAINSDIFHVPLTPQ